MYSTQHRVRVKSANPRLRYLNMAFISMNVNIFRDSRLIFPSGVHIILKIDSVLLHLSHTYFCHRSWMGGGGVSCLLCLKILCFDEENGVPYIFSVFFLCMQNISYVPSPPRNYARTIWAVKCRHGGSPLYRSKINIFIISLRYRRSIIILDNICVTSLIHNIVFL